MYSTDYYEGELLTHDEEKSCKEMISEAFTKLHETVEIYSLAENYKIQIVACSYDIAGEFLRDAGETIDIEEISTMSDYWKNLDAIPFRIKTNASSSDERASAAVRKAVFW
jgi:hypothetical protein